MPTKLDQILKVKVYPKGQVVIPASLRKKYNIDIGDHIQAIASKDGIILKPSSEKKNENMLTDGLFGVFGKYAEEKSEAAKEEVIKATEGGFVQGWEK